MTIYQMPDVPGKPHDFETPEAFVNTYAKFRRTQKGKWFGWQGRVGEKHIKVKTFNTWNQILEVDGIKHHSVADQKVGDWKAELWRAVV